MAQLSFDWAEIERSRFDPRSIYSSTESDASKLIRLPEGQHYERKSARIQPRDLCKAICAFANGDARGGVIAVGIHNGRVEGFENVGEDKLNELMYAPAQLCPTAVVHHKTVSIDSKTVLVFFVEYNETRVAELSDGKVFKRLGDRSTELSAEQVALLRDDKGETSVETQLVPHSSLHDIDQELLEVYTAAVRKELDLEFDKSTEDVLIQRRLGQIEGGRFVLRLAGYLLLAKDPLQLVPGCKVRFIRYEGTQERTGSELNVIKDVSIEGPVPHLIQRSSEVTISQLREFRALRDDGKFDLKAEYPHDCVREAIVNACVHRSYGLKNQPVFIRMFDDRLEVESPGGFIAPVTPETVYEHHSPRNPFLMNALQYMRIVRMANEGTRRMRHLMNASDLPSPEFTEAHGPISKVTVTLRNGIQQRRVWIDTDLTSIVGAHLAAALSEEEKRILNYLAENKTINVSQALRITTAKKWHAARKILDKLLDKKLIREIKSRPRDPKGHFVLSDWATPDSDGSAK